MLTTYEFRMWSCMVLREKGVKPFPEVPESAVVLLDTQGNILHTLRSTLSLQAAFSVACQVKAKAICAPGWDDAACGMWNETVGQSVVLIDEAELPRLRDMGAKQVKRTVQFVPRTKVTLRAPSIESAGYEFAHSVGDDGHEHAWCMVASEVGETTVVNVYECGQGTVDMVPFDVHTFFAGVMHSRNEQSRFYHVHTHPSGGRKASDADGAVADSFDLMAPMASGAPSIQYAIVPMGSKPCVWEYYKPDPSRRQDMEALRQALNGLYKQDPDDDGEDNGSGGEKGTKPGAGGTGRKGDTPSTGGQKTDGNAWIPNRR